MTTLESDRQTCRMYANSIFLCLTLGIIGLICQYTILRSQPYTPVKIVLIVSNVLLFVSAIYYDLKFLSLNEKIINRLKERIGDTPPEPGDPATKKGYL